MRRVLRRLKRMVRSQLAWLTGGEASERERMRSAVQGQTRLLQLRKDEAAQAMVQVVVCRERLRAHLAERAMLDENVQTALAGGEFDQARLELIQAGLTVDADLGRLMHRLEEAQHGAAQKIAAFHQAEDELAQMQADYREALWFERAGQVREQYERSLVEFSGRMNPSASSQSPRALFDQARDQALRAAELRQAREQAMTDYASTLDAEIRSVLAEAEKRTPNHVSPESPGESPKAAILPPLPPQPGAATHATDVARATYTSIDATSEGEVGAPSDDEPEWVRESRAPEDDAGEG